jgi:selenocysteine lyase/cysteine desulfurase
MVQGNTNTVYILHHLAAAEADVLQVYGPHIAMLYASPRALGQIHSLGHFFNPHNTLEQKLGLAGSSYELVYGIPAVVDYLGSGKETSKWAGIVAHEAELQATLLAYLNARDDVAVWGERSVDTAVRVATVSFTVKGWGSRDLVEAVEKESNFGFRWGSFYSVRLVEQILGLSKDGIVRVSMVHYNSGKFPVFLLSCRSANRFAVDEVKALSAALDKVLSRGKQ